MYFLNLLSSLFRYRWLPAFLVGVASAVLYLTGRDFFCFLNLFYQLAFSCASGFFGNPTKEQEEIFKLAKGLGNIEDVVWSSLYYAETGAGVGSMVGFAIWLLSVWLDSASEAKAEGAMSNRTLLLVLLAVGAASGATITFTISLLLTVAQLNPS